MLQEAVGKGSETQYIPASEYTVTPNRSLGYRFIKRLFDMIASFVGLIVLLPLFLIISIAIFIDDPGPVLFFQERNGLHGRVYRMWKFRSMYRDAPEKRFDLEAQNELDGPAFKMTNDPRVTRVGRWIRKTSVDELPQLVNILLGQMSLVGPRPERPQFVEKFREEIPRYMVKHQVRPGMTGWAQVNGLRQHFDQEKDRPRSVLH